MRRLDQIPPAWGNAEPNDPDWEKDRLIDDLRSQGHQPISVGRGILVLEQCEPGDGFPGDGCRDPIRLAVYPDPDAGFHAEPDYLYVHAGRSGLMDVYAHWSEGNQTYRYLPFDAERAKALGDAVTLVQAEFLLKLCRDLLTGNFMESTPDGNATLGQDAKLEKLGRVAVAAVRRYCAQLRKQPHLFRGWVNPSKRDTSV